MDYVHNRFHPKSVFLIWEGRGRHQLNVQARLPIADNVDVR